MICDRCGEQIPAGDETEHCGQTLCEECYMQALSPSRACDPWAVRSAQMLSQKQEAHEVLRPIQSLILQVLRETSGLEPNALAEKLGMRLPKLERACYTPPYGTDPRQETGRKNINHFMEFLNHE